MEGTIEGRVKSLEEIVVELKIEIHKVYLALYYASLSENDNEKWKIIKEAVRPFKDLHAMTPEEFEEFKTTYVEQSPKLDLG